MTTKRSMKWGLVAAAAAFVAVAAMPGCELLVDFDRSKIPQEGGEPDSTTPEVDGTSPESSLADGAVGDSSTDAPVEGSMTDALPEAAVEAGVEAGTEAGGADAGPEGSADAGPEGSAETGAASDGATDSGDDGG